MNMTHPTTEQRELLELAAKAAGLGEVWYLEGSNTPYVGPRYEPGKPIRYSIWSPLTNDGDALRLAVKLKLSPEYDDGTVYVSPGADFAACEEPLGLAGYDHFAATRRAIVRAAAAIAKGEK